MCVLLVEMNDLQNLAYRSTWNGFVIFITAFVESTYATVLLSVIYMLYINFQVSWYTVGSTVVYSCVGSIVSLCQVDRYFQAPVYVHTVCVLLSFPPVFLMHYPSLFLILWLKCKYYFVLLYVKSCQIHYILVCPLSALGVCSSWKLRQTDVSITILCLYIWISIPVQLFHHLADFYKSLYECYACDDTQVNNYLHGDDGNCWS